MIPTRLHRVVPEHTTGQVEQWWDRWRELHPGWDAWTWRDPINPTGWETGRLWPRCRSGAQLAGLIRLEVVWRYGGVYVDSDVEPLRHIGGLLEGPACFGVWEDDRTVPDWMFGAEEHHPAIRECLDRVLRMDMAAGAWATGPGVMNDVFRSRQDVTLYPPRVAAPVHYTAKHLLADRRWPAESVAVHHWHHSWEGC